MKAKKHFLFLESFYGGSHRAFADGLRDHSRHHIDLLALPARFWKWRMRGAALHFINKVPALEPYDGLITTDLMAVSDFKALAGQRCPPILVYFHENQLTYPLAPGEQMDYQFGFTDITTALAADMVRFNSQTHCESFFSGLPGFLKMMPEFHPTWVIDAIRAKSDVLYPGCAFTGTATASGETQASDVPLIIWNHRWEFDKNPSSFFDALDAVRDQGGNFHLALLGENCQTVPKVFIRARERYGDSILQYGYVPTQAAYYDWLRRGSIVVSTAQQENFGISVVEAVRFGCFPLLPDRLAYPEVIPASYHPQVLYQNQADLVSKLLHLVTRFDDYRKLRISLAKAMDQFAWDNLIADYDSLLDRLSQIR
ncbi:MAG: DUF3524 domain-containing protein [Desulfobacterales bacterium]